MAIIHQTNEISSTQGYIRLPEVLKILGISRSTFYAGIKSGKYPKPTKIGKRISGWRAEEIRKFAKSTPTQF